MKLRKLMVIILMMAVVGMTSAQEIAVVGQGNPADGNETLSKENKAKVRLRYEVQQDADNVILFKTNNPAADDVILESQVLRLEVSTNPYSYKVIEKAASKTLLSQRHTYFKLPGGTYTAFSAYNVTTSPTTMDADLLLMCKGESIVGHVAFSFQAPGLLRVKLTCDDLEPSNIKEEFNDKGEHYYGIWEYPLGGDIDNRGADHDLLGFGNMPGTNYANARAPFYVTSAGYGIYAQSMAKGHYTVAVDNKTSFDFDESSLDYYVIYGPSYEEIFSTYNQLAGPAWMPPDWAFDSVWWRDDDHKDMYPEAEHRDLVKDKRIESARDNVEATANHLQFYHIPASAIWTDRPFTSGTWGWGNMDFNPADDWFPDAGGMIEYLDARGYKFLVWITNRCENQLLSEGTASDYLFEGNRPAADVRKPEVYDWFKKKLDAFVDMSVKGYKIDRGHEGEQPDSAENEVVYLFRELAAKGQEEKNGSDRLIHARNCYDMNRKHVSVWNGDTESTFAGLAISIKNGLRCGAIIYPHYGSDTGGYQSDHPGKELFARWLQFSTYCTMMEILIDPDRTVWYDEDFAHDEDPNLIDIARRQCSEHHDLIPYTKSCMFAAHQSGMPVMRQMIFAWPDDDKLYDMWDQYMYGPEILVAPVVTSGATSREVYLPEGKWLDYNDKKTVYAGPQTITASAPLDVIPLFVRAGAIIPRGDILRSNNNWTPDWKPYLRIEFFPCKGFDNTFDYYTGDKVQPISCSIMDGAVNIKFGPLDHNGKLEIYCRDFRTVKNNGKTLNQDTDFIYNPDTMALALYFEGETSLEITGFKSIFDTD